MPASRATDRPAPGNAGVRAVDVDGSARHFLKLSSFDTLSKEASMSAATDWINALPSDANSDTA